MLDVRDDAVGSKADAVFAGVLEAIGRQRLKPGTKLQEEQLAQIFNVSRAQVRTALSRLKQRGLVELPPNRSASIAAPSVAEVRNTFALRLWIEPEIAADVAANFSRKADVALKDHLKREQTARDADDRVEATRLAGLYHTVLAGFASNRLAARYVSELVDQSFLAIYLYQRPETAMCVNEEHFGLFDAFKRKDAKAARSRMTEHLRHIVNRLDLTDRKHVGPDLDQAFKGLI